MDHRHPRRIDQIEPGFYRYRRVKGGAWMPAIVSVENGMVFIVEADQLRVGISESTYADLVCAMVTEGQAFDSPLLRVLWFGEPISEDTHTHMLAVMSWARENHPQHPMLNPDKPIKLSEVEVRHVF